jgi:hypothetical protein
VAGDQHARVVQQHRDVEAELQDGGGDLRHLPGRVGAGVGRAARSWCCATSTSPASRSPARWASDGRRYRFENKVPIDVIGLRLADVEVMGLPSEPVETLGDWARRAATLAAHGATGEEIEFLRRRRVELNAMPADMFVGFLERKLTEHGVRKMVPDSGTLERHARRVIEQRLAAEALRENRARLQAEAASAELPADLDDRVRLLLEQEPGLPWDRAVAAVVGGGEAP